MIPFFRRIAALVVAAAALSASASTTYSTDYSDVWITPNEIGHGVYIVQQGNTMFVTLFVYGGDTLPRWYFASGVTPVGGSNTSFSGQLYRSQGTSFASPWLPSGFTLFPVGNLTLNFSSAAQATLNYTVDTVSVSQQITRLSFWSDNLAGNYLGGLTTNVSQCSTPVPGGGYLIANRLTVQHTSANPVFVVDWFAGGNPSTCTFTGTYTQQGRIATMTNGTWSCTGAANNAGTFTMTEIEASRNGISARFSGRDQYCASIEGYFGGVRDVQ